jgi:prepilin-type N-terminal cleavage/methylation domain-containing protein
MRRREGFTLAELLVSLAVLGIVSIYLTNMLMQQNRAYAAVDEVTEVQSNVRAIADLLEREIRETALMAPEAAAVCIVDNTAGPDVLYVTDGDAYDFASESRYDLGANVTAGTPGAGTVTFSLADLDTDSRPFYDTDADGTADSDFRPGGAVIVVDRSNPQRGAACGPIVAGGVDLGTRRITVDFSLGHATVAAMPLGGPAAEFVVVPAHRYWVDANRRLFRDDLVLAAEVEDLQLAAFFDLDGDGNVDVNEYRGETAGTAFPPTPVWDNRELREVRFNFVVRSAMPDPNLPGAVFQALENRVAPAGGPDGFRRRAFTAAVRTRNVGHRWNAG